MDPQACLKRITDAYKDDDSDEFDAAIEDLAEWLRCGGFAPIANGPILGYTKFDTQTPICTAHSTCRRFTLCTYFPGVTTLWSIHEYSRNGKLLEVWSLPAE